MIDHKLKLPELKVQSFITSLNDEQLQEINGAGQTENSFPPECTVIMVCPTQGIGCSITCTACSTTDHYGQTHCGCTTEP